MTKYEQTQKQSTKKLAVFTAIWLVSTALFAFGPKLIWDFSFLASASILLINIVAGILMIRANLHYLKSLDELGQKIVLEAAALTLMVVMVCGIALELSELAHIISFKPRISTIYFVMGFTYMLATWLGHRRYA